MKDFLARNRMRFSRQLAALLLCLLLVPLILNSCGTSNYNTPVTSQTSATLLSPETLKTWIDSGIVNGTGYDKVIILDVTSSATYSAGRIPGAQFVNSSDIYQIRQEGPATDVNMVLDGTRMDALAQKYGIDKNTTIVLTSGATSTVVSSRVGSVLNATRAYWTFRYWGFPKEKLKVLDGINFAWQALYDPASWEKGGPPFRTPTPSTYSVKNNAGIRMDLRSSLGDMINVAESTAGIAIPVDMRSSETAGSYIGKRGSTSGVFNPSADYVVFEGKVKRARALDYTSMLITGSTITANNYRFKPADDLAGKFNAIGIDSTKIAHVY